MQPHTLPLEDMIDFEQELERLTKEEERLKKEIARSNGMLNNEKFCQQSAGGKGAGRAGQTGEI